MKLKHGQIKEKLLDSDPLMYGIIGKCTVTGKIHMLKVPVDKIDAWLQNNSKCNNHLSSLSIEVKRFLLSGISPEGWLLMQNL